MFNFQPFSINFKHPFILLSLPAIGSSYQESKTVPRKVPMKLHRLVRFLESQTIFLYQTNGSDACIHVYTNVCGCLEPSCMRFDAGTMNHQNQGLKLASSYSNFQVVLDEDDASIVFARVGIGDLGTSFVPLTCFFKVL